MMKRGFFSGPFLASVLISFPVIAALLLLSACEALPAGMEGVGQGMVSGESVSPQPSLARRGAVLVRGNARVPGIPGLGENAIPALAGEYRLEIPGAAGSSGAAGVDPRYPVFTVHSAREPLYFHPETWKPRAGTASFSAREYVSEEALLVASSIDDHEKGLWWVVFSFPRAADDPGAGGDPEAFPEELADALIQAWLARFSYFVSVSAGSSDISLPAIVYF